MLIARHSLLALTVLILASGCQSIGYQNIPRDRMGYTNAIADSWKEQMLLNIVKVRYLDTPVHMDVSSVITSYSLAREVGIGATAFTASSIGNNIALNAAGRFSESPTVSYVPLTGERLVKSMMSPISPETVFATMSSGGRADLIFRAAVQAVNGIYNVSAAPSRSRRNVPRFREIAEALQRVDEAGALGMRVEAQGDQKRTFVVFRRAAKGAESDDVALVKQLLGLDPALDVFPLVFGAARGGSGEIALLTRSIQGMMRELAAGVDVPPQDLAEGRATARAWVDDGVNDDVLMRIRSGSEQSADAFAAVFYRNRWFWVDDRDLNSKRTFRFLVTFSSLAETGATPQAPLLTIPAR